MIEFRPTVVDDISQIQNWTDLDPYHKGQKSPEWWLTGSGLLSFCLCDSDGPVFYVRIDDDEYARLSVQFAPENIVSKVRLVRAFLQAFPKTVELVKSIGKKGMVFDSSSPLLIKFMERVGFSKEGSGYSLTFGE